MLLLSYMNNNWPLVGNQHIVDFLKKSIVNDKVSNAYIFLGPGGIGKTTIARYFASTLLCKNVSSNSTEPCLSCSSCLNMKSLSSVHGDFHILKKAEGKKNIGVEQVRDFIKMLSMSSFTNSYKIGIVKGSNYLSVSASNALLKTLEEPKEKVVIILIANQIDSIPETIHSRSQILNFYPVGASVIYDHLLNEHKTGRDNALNFSRLSVGRPALALKFLENKDFYSRYFEKVEVFLSFFDGDINERLKTLEKSGFEKNSQDESLNLLEIWQSVMRDLMLLKIERSNDIQHYVIKDKLLKLVDILNYNFILKMFKLVEDCKKYLSANVSSKTVLNNVAINIK